MDDRAEGLSVKSYYETMSFKIVQVTEESPISTHFQTTVRFLYWSRTLKLKALVKIIGQRVPIHLGLGLPRMNVCALSTTFHAATERRTSGEGILGLLLIFFICLTRNSSSSNNSSLLTFNKCNFHYSFACGPLFELDHFVSKVVYMRTYVCFILPSPIASLTRRKYFLVRYP